jgi:hypothetical protein
MALHLVKLAVGAESIEDLAHWQAGRLRVQKLQGVTAPKLWHTTFQRPKREADLLDGGSLYWVIKGVILVRQRLTGFSEGHKEDGSACCLLELDPTLIGVRPTPRRPFQGWRYLTADDAPPDLASPTGREQIAEMPPAMRRELAQLGLL